MKKLKQTSLDQTGIAILSPEKNSLEEIKIPLFSEKPTKEANELLLLFPSGTIIRHVFISNNLLDYKIEDCIKEFQKEFSNVLPENMMDEMVSGFPFIRGYTDSPESTKYVYG